MNLTELIESVILSNMHPKQERKIGIECESILYDKELKRIPADSDQTLSSIDIIMELEKLQSNNKTKPSYTLEPGGQIEWASPPLQSLHEISRSFKRNKTHLQRIIEREKLKILNYSLEPFYTPADIPLINSEKYRLMNDRFTKTGKLGKWMMRNTTSIQINFDYSTREEAEKMTFVVDCITPLTAIFFANSPFWQGKPAGKNNLRYKIWNDTDASRCGDLLDHEIYSDIDLISKYAEYVQTIPAIFVQNKEGEVSKFKGTLGEWLEQLDKEHDLTTKEIQIALHQIFTNVRFKNVIEIRGCDKPPAGFEMAPAAFWAGLLLDDNALEKAYQTVSRWTFQERKKLQKRATILNLEQEGPQKHSIREWIEIIVNISKKGLDNRAIKLNISSERVYLDKYHDYFKKYGIPAIFAQKNASINSENVQNFIK